MRNIKYQIFNRDYNIHAEMLVIFLFVDALLGLFIALKYEIALPYSYLFIFILIYTLLLISLKYNLTRIYPILAVFYTISIVSVFAFRFGMFQGDSTIDLASTQYIIRHGFVDYLSDDVSRQFPVIHILTVSIGTVIGMANIEDIYYIAIYIPTIAAILSTLFIYLSVNKITGNNKYALFASIIWISLPFVSRWMIQYTRTTIAIPFLIILIYLLVKTDETKMIQISSNTIIMILLISTVIIAHPVVSLFGTLSLLCIFIYEVVRISIGKMNNNRLINKFVDNTPSNKQINTLLLIPIVFLLAYWMYNARMMYPLLDTLGSMKTFFTESTIRAIVTGETQNSVAIAPTEFKILGISRALLFFFISAVGVLFIAIDRRLKSIVVPLCIFAGTYILLNLAILPASTTCYRAAVYASIMFILATGYFINKILLNKTRQGVLSSVSRKRKNRKKLVVVIVLVAILVLVLPAPFFTGEVVLPSDWLYSPYPSNCIEYEKGEAQRFVEHYHIDVPIWINNYTDNSSLIGLDGANEIGFMLGYGDRRGVYHGDIFPQNGTDLDKLELSGINYMVVDDLMRKVILIPYGAIYYDYNFKALDTSSKSYRIYDSGDANIYKILGKV